MDYGEAAFVALSWLFPSDANADSILRQATPRGSLFESWTMSSQSYEPQVSKAAIGVYYSGRCAQPADDLSSNSLQAESTRALSDEMLPNSSDKASLDRGRMTRRIISALEGSMRQVLDYSHRLHQAGFWMIGYMLLCAMLLYIGVLTNQKLATS